jgi:hypothetical protein
VDLYNKKRKLSPVILRLMYIRRSSALTNVALGRAHVTIAAVEKQEALCTSILTVRL